MSHRASNHSRMPWSTDLPPRACALDCRELFRSAAYGRGVAPGSRRDLGNEQPDPRFSKRLQPFLLSDLGAGEGNQVRLLLPGV